MSSSRLLWLCLILLALGPACGEEPEADGDGDADVDGDSDGDGDADVDGDSDGDGDGDGDADGDGDGDCGEGLHEGEGTYYQGADGTGTCSFPATPDDHRHAAMNQTDFDTAAACGACIAVEGPSGEVRVRIVNLCPECPQGNVDFSPEAFDEIAARELGRVDISWRYVPCEVSGPIRYHFQDGSSQWWTSVQVRNHRHRIARFEFLDEGGVWQEVTRQHYNYFVWDAGMGPGPYSFRVTDVYGDVLTDSDVPLELGAEVEGGGQFPPCP